MCRPADAWRGPWASAPDGTPYIGSPFGHDRQHTASSSVSPAARGGGSGGGGLEDARARPPVASLASRSPPHVSDRVVARAGAALVGGQASSNGKTGCGHRSGLCTGAHVRDHSDRFKLVELFGSLGQRTQWQTSTVPRPKVARRASRARPVQVDGTAHPSMAAPYVVRTALCRVGQRTTPPP